MERTCFGCEPVLNVDQEVAAVCDQLVTAQVLDPLRNLAVSAWPRFDTDSLQNLVNLGRLFAPLLDVPGYPSMAPPAGVENFNIPREMAFL